eukprot:2078837-Pyramimonas_sp.AAC.1
MCGAAALDLVSSPLFGHVAWTNSRTPRSHSGNGLMFNAPDVSSYPDKVFQFSSWCNCSCTESVTHAFASTVRSQGFSHGPGGLCEECM